MPGSTEAMLRTERSQWRESLRTSNLRSSTTPSMPGRQSSRAAATVSTTATRASRADSASRKRRSPLESLSVKRCSMRRFYSAELLLNFVEDGLGLRTHGAQLPLQASIVVVGWEIQDWCL